jgi:outer membrane lipoprotein-sorting protein
VTPRPQRSTAPARGLALACLAAALWAAGAARAVEPETWHAETLTSSPRGVQATQYWSKGPGRMRAETVVAGHRLVTIVNGDVYYAVNATLGSAVAIKRSERAIAETKKRPRLVGIEGFMIRERGGEKIGSEPISGRMCDVYKQTDSDGRRQVWVQQDGDDLLPLRVEFYNRRAGALIRTDYVQWAAGLELPDRLFEPDPRFSLVELEYEEFVSGKGDTPFMVPVLHANLLHGER